MHKVIAFLLLAVLSLNPSWAGGVVHCGSDNAIEAPAASPPADVAAAPGDDGDRVDCCAGSAAADVPCGPDCENCQGLGTAVLAASTITVAVMPACPGDSTHAGRLPAPLPGETLRPPAPAIA